MREKKNVKHPKIRFQECISLIETYHGPGKAVFSARVPYDKAHKHACTGKGCRAVCSCDWMLLRLCAVGLKDGATYFNQARCIFACWDKTDRPWSIMFADEHQVTTFIFFLVRMDRALINIYIRHAQKEHSIIYNVNIHIYNIEA
jgi:hypothetical protein